MDFETIIYEKDGGKARITLNRPEKLNALSAKVQRELNQAFWEADNDAAVHCVILRGAGRAFCAGYDLTPMQSPPGGLKARALTRAKGRTARRTPTSTAACRTSTTTRGSSNASSATAW